MKKKKKKRKRKKNIATTTRTTTTTREMRWFPRKLLLFVWLFKYFLFFVCIFHFNVYVSRNISNSVHALLIWINISMCRHYTYTIDNIFRTSTRCSSAQFCRTQYKNEKKRISTFDELAVWESGKNAASFFFIKIMQGNHWAKKKNLKNKEKMKTEDLNFLSSFYHRVQSWNIERCPQKCKTGWLNPLQFTIIISFSWLFPFEWLHSMWLNLVHSNVLADHFDRLFRFLF